MVNLLCFLCSMCLQFGAIGYGNIAPDYKYIVDDVQTNLSNGNSWQKSYARVSDELWYVFAQENGTYLLCFPNEAADSSITSSETVNSLINDNIGVNVTFRKYVFMTWNGTTVYFEWPNSKTMNIYYYTDDIVSYPELLYVGRESFYYDGEYQVDLSVHEDVTVPVLLSQLGSLGHSGYSGDYNPVDALNNSSFNWASVTGHSNGGASGPSPHSSSTHFSSSTPSPDSNDSKTDSLLYMIGNKLADITENTGAIGDALGGIMYNQVAGASAIFNAISNINNTIASFINYIIEPLDQERISAKLEEVPLYQTVNSLVGFSDSFLSAINSVQDPEHLYLTMDFRTANEPFRRLGLYVFDFTFLDDLKSTWQPILLAILYVTLGVNIFYDLPNIVHGISGLSGGDE